MDKSLLFKPRLPEDTVEVPGVGVLRVRGLNRLEAMHVQAAKGPEETERRILALGMVDPKLTEDEVRQWQRASAAGEIEPVSTRIAQLSGMVAESPKQAYQDFEADPGSEFRLLPSAEAGDDGGSPPGGSE